MTEVCAFDFTTTALHRSRAAIKLWALGREGEVQRRGIRAVMRDLCQTPSIQSVDMEQMGNALKRLYGLGGTRSQFTGAYRRRDRALEL